MEVRKGEELKAPRHASAATTRDDRLPHSRHWQLFFCSCYLYTLIDYCYIKILSEEEEEERWGLMRRQRGRQGASSKRANSDFPSRGWKILIGCS